MKAKILFGVLGVLALAAAGIMYSFRNDSHLSELGDVWWVPLPLGAITLVLAITKKGK